MRLFKGAHSILPPYRNKGNSLKHDFIKPLFTIAHAVVKSNGGEEANNAAVFNYYSLVGVEWPYDHKRLTVSAQTVAVRSHRSRIKIKIPNLNNII